MEDNFTYLFGAAVVAVILVIYNHIRQKSKMTKFMSGAGAMQPVFLQQAVEKKLIKLKTALHHHGSPVLQGAPSQGFNQQLPQPPPKKKASQYSPHEIKQLMIQRLTLLEDHYACGKINLKTYNDKLHELVDKLNMIR